MGQVIRNRVAEVESLSLHEGHSFHSEHGIMSEVCSVFNHCEFGMMVSEVGLID